MGIDPRQIPLRFRRTVTAAARAVPEVCSVGAFLPIRVPTVGLHDKGNFVRGGRYSSHADSKALKAAKALYLQTLPTIARPVAPPIAMTAHFVLQPPVTMERFEGVLPYTGKPDLSNLLKLFEDCLRVKGWMVDDALVAQHAERKWVSFDPSIQGVLFTLSTIGEEVEPLSCLQDRAGAPPYTAVYRRRGGEAGDHR